MKLSVVIPAYNEEAALPWVLERAVAVRARFLESGTFQDVEILVMNDGSTDSTAATARRFPVRVVDNPGNLGYGATVLCGLALTEGEVLAFLDADRTCDPAQLWDMHQTMRRDGAGLVIGSRLGPGSEMPRVRRLGNRLYAWLINFLGGHAITDCASGMRLFTREALQALLPLPAGMDLTPAMTAKALMDESIGVTEHPITYRERSGRSKLNVLRDGVRFFATILQVMVTYRPLKFFGGLGLAAVAAGLALSWRLVALAFQGPLPDWALYRAAAVGVLVVSGVLAVGYGLLANVIMIQIQPIRRLRDSAFYRGLTFVARPSLLIGGGSLSALAGVGLNGPGIWSYMRYGQVSSPWTIILLGAFLVLLGIIGITLGCALSMTRLIAATIKQKIVDRL